MGSFFPNRRSPVYTAMPAEMPGDGGFALAMAYVMMQCWGQTYDPAVALQRGTVFPELDLPFCCGGVNR